MYATAMPAIATLTMAENHIRTDSIGLQLQAECWYEQEELTATNVSCYIFDHENHGQKKPRKTTVRWAPVLGQGSACTGGGCMCIRLFDDACISIRFASWMRALAGKRARDLHGPYPQANEAGLEAVSPIHRTNGVATSL